MYTVIAENDITKWADETGIRYHFPKRYRSHLSEGTRLIHYKGKMTKQSFMVERLSPDPHYFAISVAGKQSLDPESQKGDMFVEINSFQQFPLAVPIRDANSDTLEFIPENRKANFWRDGARRATEEIFDRIVSQSGLVIISELNSSADEADELDSIFKEGKKVSVFTSRYERDPKVRAEAIKAHGTSCKACDVLLSSIYGELADGYIQIHHKRPLNQIGSEVYIDPLNDCIPLCPNCHAMVHRRKDKVVSINALRALLGKEPIPYGD